MTVLLLQLFLIFAIYEYKNNIYNNKTLFKKYIGGQYTNEITK